MNILDSYAKQFSKPLEDLFAKAPALPTNVKETLVKYAPILSLIGGVILVLLMGLGSLMAVNNPWYQAVAYMAGPSYSMQMMFYAAVLIVSGVLMLLAYGPLKKRELRGWNLMFWGQIIWLVADLIKLEFLSLIIGALIGFYFLFQLKSYYK